MSAVQQEKASWNKYDNIWEIRKELGLPTPGQIEEALTKVPPWPIRTERIGKGILYCGPAPTFIYAVAHIEEIQEKTVWKIICPSLENPNQGSIYYIIKANRGNLIYSSTSYGYQGGGPLAAALIEACLEKLGFQFEIREGDYLLSFL